MENGAKRRVTLSAENSEISFSAGGALYHLLGNPIYIGKTAHKGKLHDGMHEAIINQETWNQSRELLSENAVKRRRGRCSAITTVCRPCRSASDQELSIIPS